jgi:hypothetical protein
VLTNRESNTYLRANNKLTIKLKRKYIKKPLPKTRDNRFRTCSLSKKPNSDSSKAGDSIVAALSSLLKSISVLGNTKRSYTLISNF